MPDMNFLKLRCSKNFIFDSSVILIYGIRTFDLDTSQKTLFFGVVEVKFF